MKSFSALSIPVPSPLGLAAVQPPISGYTEALFTEDLGELRTATEYLQSLIKSNQEQRVMDFENTLIDITAQIIQSGFIDVDHGLVNTVVTSSGNLIRLDFELARRVFFPHCFPSALGEMLGRTILLHGFAVQPQVKRTTLFAQRLFAAVNPSKTVKRVAQIYINRHMLRQRSNTGIDTRIDLPND